MAGETGAAISVTIFVLTSTLALFITPLVVKEFSRLWWVDLVIKRGFWVIGAFLMTLNAAIMATLAGSANIPLTDEMFFFMWLFGWAGYVLMVWLAFKTLLDVIATWKENLRKRRMGEDE